MKKYILALDQGTTSSRSIIFDEKGEIIASAQREFPQIYPVAGWVEHDPLDIWESQYKVIVECIESAGISISQIDSIGITNQRETVIVWDRATGKPVYNAIVWQCRRTSDYCEELKKSGWEEKIYQKTGLIVDPYFSASKIKWILDKVPGARKRAKNGELCFGTVDTFLMWKLSNGKIFATDHTNASRTMLFNIHNLEWDDELLSLFDIPKSMLPSVLPSSFHFGKTDSRLLGREIDICGVAGDQQSALFGQLCHKKGSMKNTYGTGCFLLMHTGDVPAISNRGLLTTMAVSIDGTPQYALEGSVFVGGAVVQWLRDEMEMIESARETEALALSVPNTNGVYIVPSFVGMGAPHWISHAKGAIFGLTRGAGKRHIVRAALESIAYQVFDVVHAMEADANVQFEKLAVDGGACANNFLMQFQADIAKIKVVRPKIVETTALGVAYLAGLASGYWASIDEIEKRKVWDREFTPRMKEKDRMEKIIGWEECILALKLKGK